MSLKKYLMLLVVLIITALSCAVLIVTHKNKQPVYTDTQKKFIEIANERLESFGYEFEDTVFKYAEFDAFDETVVDREQLPEYLKSVKNFCVIHYSPKEKYTLGGVATVYIDMETENVLHVYLGK